MRSFLTLQAIRGFAALAVVVFHRKELFADTFMAPLAERFYLGVDVFFIVSGFVMAFSTRNRAKSAVAGFAVRRVFRIVPLSWATTGLILLIDHASFEHVARSLLFFPELPPSKYLVNPAQWTISFEFMFYTIFMIALSASHRYRCEVCIAIVAMLAIVDAAGLLEGSGFVLFNYVYLCEFASGVFLGRILMSKAFAKAGAGWQLAASVGLVASGAFCVFVYAHNTDDRLFGIAAFLLVSGILVFEEVSRIDVPAPILFLGEISFAIYICQYFAFMFVDSKVFWTPLHRTWLYAHTQGPTRFLLILAVLLALSCLLHFWVEQPGIRYGQRLAARLARPSTASTNSG